MKKVFVICACILSCGCSSNEKEGGHSWIKLGLDGLVVNELVIDNNNLYAATSDGLFQKMLDGSDQFERIGLAGMNVEDIIVFSQERIMASYVDRTYVAEPGLYLTTNAGSEWTKLASDFGGDAPEPVFDLVEDPDDPQILYGGGFGVIAKSIDGGMSWNPIWGEWQRLATGIGIVTLSPTEKHLWAGGQGAIENGFLLRDPEGANGEEWYDLVANPTVVKEIIFADDDHVLAGFEGALIRTADGGENWETLIESDENRFFFGIGLSVKPGRIYAGGWLKGGADQPLKLFVSEDGGATWQILDWPAEDKGGIFDLQIQSTTKEDRIFLGLDKGGVYEVRIRK